MARTTCSWARQAVLLIVLLGGLAATVVAVAASATDWPEWRGPSRSGVTPEKVAAWPAGGPRHLWSANVGKSYAAVAVQGGRVYAVGAANGEETVWCLEAGSGRVLWKHTQAHPQRTNPYEPDPTASTGTPVVAGERVYLLTREGLALCLAAKEGKIAWQRDLARETENGLPPFGCGSSPLCVGDQVIYNIGKQGIALDRRTGAVVWNSGPGVAGHASAVAYRIGGQSGVCLFTGDALVAVEPKTGRQLWRYPWSSANHINGVDPIVSGDRIFITGYGQAAQLRLAGETVSTVYEARVLRSTFSNPVLLNGYLYGSDRGMLQCVDWATGTERWNQPGILRHLPGQEADGVTYHAMSEGALIAAGSHLIALDDSGTLRLIVASPDAYREVARASVLKGPCWTIPVLANGLLYCRNNGGDLVCLDLRPPQRRAAKS
jgi:outer membrane protein assembly factor BamB